MSEEKTDVKSLRQNLGRNQRLYTVLKGTRVYWDEDYDERILLVASALIDACEYIFGYNPILAIQEHEGTLTIVVDRFFEEYQNLPDLLGGSFDLKKFLENAGNFSELIVADYWSVIEIEVVKSVPSPFARPIKTPRGEVYGF